MIERPSLWRCLGVLASVPLRLESESPTVTLVEPDRGTSTRCVHVLFAGERFHPEDRYPLPTLDCVVANIAPFPVVDLTDLVAMKLQANRLYDKVQIIDMKGVNLITPALVATLPPDLRERLRQIPEPDTH